MGCISKRRSWNLLFSSLLTLSLMNVISEWCLLLYVVKFLRDMEYISSFNSIPVVFMQSFICNPKNSPAGSAAYIDEMIAWRNFFLYLKKVTVMHRVIILKHCKQSGFLASKGANMQFPITKQIDYYIEEKSYFMQHNLTSFINK